MASITPIHGLSLGRFTGRFRR
jgi:hypothetical protein